MANSNYLKPSSVYHNLTHVRHDLAHCLAPGLFRSLKRGDRKRMRLDVVYEYGNNESIRFKGPEPLGADDLRILQGIVAMAGPNGLVLAQDSDNELGQQLRLFLDLRWDAIFQDVLVVKQSYRSLAKEIGMDPDRGDTFKTIRLSIDRLFAVSIYIKSGSVQRNYRLLSACESDDKNKKLLIAINPRIT